MKNREESSLVTAVENSDLKALESLVSETGFDKRSPELMKVAIRRGNFQVLNILINSGASCKKKCKYGKPPIFYGILSADLEVVKKLVSHGASLEDAPNRSVLSLAVKVNVLGIIEYLIQLGADPNDAIEPEKPPMFYAVKNSNIRAMDLLLLRGADMTSPELLRCAVRHSSLETIEFLLVHGGNPNCISNPVFPQKKHGSAKASNNDLLWDEDFIAQISKLTTNCRKEDFFPEVRQVQREIGGTALHLAIDEGRSVVVKLLLKYGADVNITSPEGLSPLFVATNRGLTEILQILIDHGANIDYKDSNGNTAFHQAAKKGKIDVFRTLLDNVFLNPDRLVRSGILKDVVTKNFDVDKKSDIWKQSVELLARYVMKIRAVGLSISAENSSVLQCCSEEKRKKFMLLCRLEISKLKAEVFGEIKVSMYDILTKSSCQVAEFLKDKSVFEAFRNAVGKKFFTFGSILSVQFHKGALRRELLDHSEKLSFYLCPKFSIFKRIGKNIFCYLSNDDLRALIISVRRSVPCRRHPMSKCLRLTQNVQD